MVGAILRAEPRRVVAGRGGDHVLDGGVATCRRVAEVSGRTHRFRCEIRLARPRRRRRSVVGPDTPKNPIWVAGGLAGAITEDRAGRYALTVLGNAVQPAAAADATEEIRNDRC